MVLDRLREAGFAPAAESPDGTVLVLRASGAPHPGPATSAAAWRRATGAHRCAGRRGCASPARRGARCRQPAPALPDGTGSGRLPRTTTTETLDQLRIALAAERAVWIGYADPAGVTTERVVELLRLEGGFLTGYDLRTAQVRTFTIARITAVAAVAP